MSWHPASYTAAFAVRGALAGATACAADPHARWAAPSARELLDRNTLPRGSRMPARLLDIVNRRLWLVGAPMRSDPDGDDWVPSICEDTTWRRSLLLMLAFSFPIPKRRRG
jgi:hypothetical protein